MTGATLTLAQWFSPAYPVGAFAYSHGLEQAIQDQRIQTAHDLDTWLGDILHKGAGRNDAILLVAAYNEEMPIDELDELARALCPSRERLTETLDQGAAFADVTAAIWDGDAQERCFPVAVGVAARLCALPLDLTTAMFLQSVTSNLVAAAVRLVPLGQTEGQAVLAGLTPLCQSIANDATHQTTHDLGSCAFVADIASMQHETLQTRVFRT